jgi:hypothetical protein
MALTLYAFQDLSVFEALQMAKKFDINRSMNKDLIYGGLLELSRNRLVWHESTVSPEYSHLTEDGKIAIIHIVENMFRGLQVIHQTELKEEAKKQTLEALKA